MTKNNLLTDNRIAEILLRAETCDDSVLTDYADIAAAMQELQYNRKISNAIQNDMKLAIEAMLDMHQRVMKQTNHSASFFDAETILAMNYAPIQAKQALERARLRK
ncbi:hypothetical protein I4495_16305 [Klebsiella oxytoca]|uniref:hypothetical protein n=1 Tax=Klebsiella TaxID=570 RepID=UPI00116CD6E2|nr:MULTISPECIES: hypothetical protein [Klebsiella]MBG2577072.1 hypothetical protein [Klebsiella oxytoca]MBX8917175.1 hypothetical protein [Klebsiella michiganensis]MBZ7405065.1 hypothetical protein [Klebsiella grimontii]MCW9606704.1 hypothetical protein [Klebsiella oxytoca]MCW9673635.1 hypothetical protein [Klebsiella oxytoca]